jgi:MerR family transcriptional regulator, thiopeptide resistance regulator
MYTVKQLARLAGVTVRTLHHYDQIGLLKPSEIGDNSYRYYNDQALFRLQQILLFREMGMDLQSIREVFDRPDFDQVSALQAHRQALQTRIQRLKDLIKTVDTTIMHILGEVKMSNKTIFQGFSPEKQEQYEQEAIEQWGETARQSIRLWNSYSAEKKAAIMQEGGEIYTGIAARMDLGPGCPEVQALLSQWHQHMRYFYEPALEGLRGLGEMYHDHPDFNATFNAIHPDLPAFLKAAIAIYVDKLETQ